MSKNSYEARLIKDLAVTFNYVPLTTTDVARFWKRSKTDVTATAKRLEREGVLKFNARNEMVVTSQYKTYFKRNPQLALAVAANGF